MIQFGKTVDKSSVWHQTRGDIFSEFGDFVLKTDKSEKASKKAEKFYKKALKIYQKTGKNNKIQEVQGKLNQ